MAITIKAYGLFLESLCEGRVDFEQDALKCMLVAPGYTLNQDVHKFKSSISYEVVGSGYAAGGRVVDGVRLSYSAVDNRLKIDGSDLVWPTLTVPAIKYGVLYMNTGGSAASMPLVAIIDFDQTIALSNEALYITWPNNGILGLTVPA